MKSAAAARPLWQAAAVAAGLSSSTAMAAEWTLEPTAEIYTQAQRNPRHIANNDDDATAYGTRATVRIQRRTERLQLSIQPAASIVRYQQVEGLDRNDQYLRASALWLDERTTWRGEASGTHDTTLTSELGTTGLTQVNSRHEGYSISGGPEWQLGERSLLGANLAWQIDRYPTAPEIILPGSHYTTASTYFSYKSSENTSLSVGASVGKLASSSTRTGSDNASLMLQMRHAFSPLWALDISAGPSWMRAGQLRSERGSIYNAQLSRAFDRASVAVGVSQRLSPSGRGVLTEVQEATIDFSMKFTERLSGRVNAGKSYRTDAFAAYRLDLQDVRYSHVDVGLSWRPSQNWQLSLELGNSTQNSASYLRDQDTAYGYYARVALGWLGKPYVN